MTPGPISRRRVLQALLAGAAASLVAACSDSSDGAPAPTSTAPTAPTNPPPSPPSPTPEPSPTPAPDVPLETKIGEMIMMGFTGQTIETMDDVAQGIREGEVGSVVLFDRNVASPAQLAALNQSIALLGATTPLIAVDQEGGHVARLRPDKGFPESVSALYLGNRDVGLTRQYASVMAEALRAAGINLNLAPVLDVNVNPSNPAIGFYERSFSADPEVVAEHGLAFVRAHHEHGVLCTLKHFAGHGSSTADSHLGLVDVSQTWSPDELIPFRRVIEAGEADAVMTAHIFNAQIDSDYPGTLSYKTITGLLREQLGFEGVVITDDMQMGAIRDYYGFNQAVQLAILAGADVIAVSNNLNYQSGLANQTYNAIKLAVESGAVSEDRIDQSYQRIHALKARLA